MTFSIHGLSPSTPSGVRFDRNNFGWHVIVDVVELVGPPEIVGKCLWRCNYQDGLDAEDAVELANVLDEALRAGRIAAYVACGGGDEPNRGDPIAKAFAASGISTKTIARPLSVADVREFV